MTMPDVVQNYRTDMVLGPRATQQYVLAEFGARTIPSCSCPFCKRQWTQAQTDPRCFAWKPDLSNDARWPNIDNNHIRESECRCFYTACTDIIQNLANAKATPVPTATAPALGPNTLHGLNVDCAGFIEDPGTKQVYNIWANNRNRYCLCFWCNADWCQSSDGKHVSNSINKKWLKPSDCACCVTATQKAVTETGATCKLTERAVSGPCICKLCNMKNEFAEPNQKDGSYVCYSCR